MNVKKHLIKLHWLLSAQFGIDPRKAMRSLLGLPRYLRDLTRFRAQYSGRLDIKPCLHDWYEEGGTTKNEYFWQDLLVAQMIFEANPDKHVDVGSRIDGFVGHVASFREIEVFDIRPITAKIPGVTFKQADLMKMLPLLTEYCDSLSCLHALEHFGLGRYGDQVDQYGWRSGFNNMANLLKVGGVFYLSVPIGTSRIEFNANHVFSPINILDLAKKMALYLDKFIVIHQNGAIDRYQASNLVLDNLSNEFYALGIFVFIKKNDTNALF